MLQQKTRLILCTLFLLPYSYCCDRNHALSFVPCTCWFTFTVTIENTPYSLYVVLVALLLRLQQKTRRILCTLCLQVYFYCYNRKHALFFVRKTCWFTFTVKIENTPYPSYIVLVSLLLLLQQKLRLIPCTLYLLVYFYCYKRKHALFVVPCTCCFTFTVTKEKKPFSLYLVLLGLHLLLQQKTRLILCTLYLLGLLLMLQQKTRLILCTLYLLVYFYCYKRKHPLFFARCSFWLTFTVTIENTPHTLFLVLVALRLLLQQKTRLIHCTLYMLVYFYRYNRKHDLFFARCTFWFNFTVTIENTPRSLYLVLVALLLLSQQKTHFILCTLYLLLYFYCYNKKHALFFVPCTCWFTFTVTIDNTSYLLYLVLVGLLLLLQQKTRLILCTLYMLLYFYCYKRKHAVFFVHCTCGFTSTVTTENTPYSLYLVLVGLLLLLQQKTPLIVCTLYFLLYFYCYKGKHALFIVPCTCCFTFTVTIENTPYSLYLVLVGLLLLLQQKTRLILCTLYLLLYFTVTIETRLILCTLYLLVYFYCYNRKHALFFVPCTCCFTFTVTIENTPYSLYLVLVGLPFLLQQKTRRLHVVLFGLLLLLQQKTRLIHCTLYLLLYFYCYNRKHALFFVPCTCCFTFTVTIENTPYSSHVVPLWSTFTVTIENTPYSLYLVLVGLILLLHKKTRLVLCTFTALLLHNRKHALFFVPCTCCLLLLLQQKTRLILCTLYLLVYFYCYNRKHALFLYLVLVGLLLLLQQKTRLILCTLYLLVYFYCYNRKHALFFVPCTCWFTFTVTIENTPYSLYLVLVALLLLLQQKTHLILCTLYLLLYFYCYNKKTRLIIHVVPCTCCTGWFTFTVTIENTPYSLYLVLVGLLYCYNRNTPVSLYLVLVGLLLPLQQKTRLILCTLYLLVYFYCYNRKHALFFVPCTCWFTFTVTIETRLILCTLYLLVYFYCYNRKHALFLYLVLVALLLLLQQKTRRILCTLYFFLHLLLQLPYSLYIVLLPFTVTIETRLTLHLVCCFLYCYKRKHAVFLYLLLCFTFTVTIENTPYSLYLYLLLLLLFALHCTLYCTVTIENTSLSFVPCTCWFTFTVTIENTPYSLYLVLVALLLLLQQKTRRIHCYLVLVGLLLLLQQKTRLILCTLYLLLYFYCYNRKHALFFVPCTCCFTFTVTIENTPYSLYLVHVALLLLLQQKTRRIICTLYLLVLLLLLQQKTRLILCTLYFLVYFYCYNRKHALFFVPCSCCSTFTVTIENTTCSLYLVLVGLLLLLQQKTRLILSTLYLLVYFYCYNRKHAVFFVPCTCWFTFTVTIENTPYSLHVVLFGLILLLQQKTRLILCTLYLLLYFYCHNRIHTLFFVPCTCCFTFAVTIKNTHYSLYLVLVGLLLLLQQKTPLILCTLYMLLYFFLLQQKTRRILCTLYWLVYFYRYNRKHALFIVPCTCWFTFTVTTENTPYSLYLVLVGLLLLLQQKTPIIVCTLYFLVYFYCYKRKHALFIVPCTCWFTFTVTVENTSYSLYLVLVGLLLLLQQKTRRILCTLYFLVYIYCYNRKQALFFVHCSCCLTRTVTIENTSYPLYLVLVGLLLLSQQKTHLILCTLYLLLFVYCYNKKHVLFFVPCTCRFTFTVTKENTPYSLYPVHVALLLLLQQKTRRIICTLYFLVYFYC